MLLCEFYLNVLKDFAHLLNPTRSVLNLPLRPYGHCFPLSLQSAALASLLTSEH